MTIVRVMTFNIFSPGEPESEEDLIPGELENTWERRAPLNLRTIKRYQPDLIGFQEMDREKFDSYRRELTGYGSTTLQSDVGSSTTILWRIETCEVSHSGLFYLSRTPDTPSADW